MGLLNAVDVFLSVVYGKNYALSAADNIRKVKNEVVNISKSAISTYSTQTTQQASIGQNNHKIKKALDAFDE